MIIRSSNYTTISQSWITQSIHFLLNFSKSKYTSWCLFRENDYFGVRLFFEDFSVMMGFWCEIGDFSVLMNFRICLIFDFFGKTGWCTDDDILGIFGDFRILRFFFFGLTGWWPADWLMCAPLFFLSITIRAFVRASASLLVYQLICPCFSSCSSSCLCSCLSSCLCSCTAYFVGSRDHFTPKRRAAARAADRTIRCVRFFLIVVARFYSLRS